MLYLDVTLHKSLEMEDWGVAKAKLSIDFDREPVPPYTDREDKFIRRMLSGGAPKGSVVGGWLYRDHKLLKRTLN